MFKHPQREIHGAKLQHFFEKCKYLLYFLQKKYFYRSFCNSLRILKYSIYSLAIKSKHTILIYHLACVHNKMVCLIDDFIFRTRY